MFALQSALAGCARHGSVPPAAAYSRPPRPVRAASRPRGPKPDAGPTAPGPASTPAMTDADKDSLFQRFDEWENQQAGAAGPEPAAATSRPGDGGPSR